MQGFSRDSGVRSLITSHLKWYKSGRDLIGIKEMIIKTAGALPVATTCRPFQGQYFGNHQVQQCGTYRPQIDSHFIPARSRHRAEEVNLHLHIISCLSVN